jgi:geranylgeranyl pyrophosphate synthase/uncharacterized protein with NAD-binding domain and iron-sulfur cluster
MPKVVVLGGGVAGMSAAHELSERGYEVVVLERSTVPGGKARSIPVSDDGTPIAREVAEHGIHSIYNRLPGEHGFRFFPGFYKHIIDTMRRIPSFDGRVVTDHLVATHRVGFAQYEKPIFFVLNAFPRTVADAATLLRNSMLIFGANPDLTPEELAFFTARFWQILTSCEKRRIAEYEKIGWWDFVDAENRSAAYRKFLAVGFTRSLVAAEARKASARTVGDMFMQMMLTVTDPTAGSADRVLDGPTNLVWIDPWVSYLESKGVRYLEEAEIEEIQCRDGKIAGISYHRRGRRVVERGDYYIAALPLERIAPMINKQMLAIDPALANLSELAPNVEWMNGIQFYLRRDVPMAPGHIIHVDTEWCLTSISQVQFWKSFSPQQFGDAGTRGVLSVDISEWEAPGSNGRPAMQCSREEVAREVWRQLKRSVNHDQELLRDEDLDSWFLDPDIKSDPARPGFLHNAEPLLVNYYDTWNLRPDASTGISNLFLASDYVRTFTDLATMEGANEAARRAVNGLLDADDHSGPRCSVWPLHEPPLLAPWRLYDASRFEAGLPWDASLMQVASQAIGGASPVLELARPLLDKMEPFVGHLAHALDPTGIQTSSEELAGEDPRVRRPAANASGSPDTAPPETGPMSRNSDRGPGQFLERLSWYRDMLSETLAAAIPTDEPQRHLYALIKDFVDRSGKGLRPALCIATARALGGRGEDAFPAAAGLEMLHNAFLVHDDIEDGSESRRGLVTMHRRVGVPIAVNTGDAMNALAMRLFRKSGERLGPVGALRILDEVDHMLFESLEGQAIELGWVRDNDLTVSADDYMRLVLKKTAWYSFIHPMRIGALVADQNDHNLDRFDRFGYLIGLAFQITDDVLNLVGNEARYGKEIDGDLWEGKRTIVLTHALERAKPQDREWVREFLRRPRDRRLPREVLRLHNMLASGGSIQWAQAAARALAEAAAHEFNVAFAQVPPSPDLEWLRGSVDFLVRRDM